MYTPDLESYISHGHEERNLEYKQSMSWNDADSRGNLIKRIMSMANIRDGGVVVVGMREDGDIYTPEGVQDDHLSTFRGDNISTDVNEYASPFVELSVDNVLYETKPFVVIQVREFAEMPVVCRKTGPAGLREGALYTRSHRKPETVEVSSEPEMREILELAVDKGIRKLFTRLERVGLHVPLITPAEAEAKHLEQFKEERGEL
jgi:hypothetical protein